MPSDLRYPCNVREVLARIVDASELDEFKDLVPDMPTTELRVGYAAAAPPPLRDRASPQLQPGRRVPTGQK